MVGLPTQPTSFGYGYGPGWVLVFEVVMYD